MQTEKDKTIRLQRLSDDSGYYTHVFKKTEKIVSVILYIMSETKETSATSQQVQLIKDKALMTHEISLETLAYQTHQQTEGINNFVHVLVALDSTLRIAHMAKVIPTDIFALITDQLDTVFRYLGNHYLKDQGIKVEELVGDPEAKKSPARGNSSATPRQRRVNIPAGDISTDAYLVYSQMTDRAERIKTVLEAKPQATIKDISEVITDVSEKTIQRELNSLIEKGQVLREGERRWSKYSATK